MGDKGKTEENIQENQKTEQRLLDQIKSLTKMIDLQADISISKEEGYKMGDKEELEKIIERVKYFAQKNLGIKLQDDPKSNERVVRSNNYNDYQKTMMQINGPVAKEYDAKVLERVKNIALKTLTKNGGNIYEL